MQRPVLLLGIVLLLTVILGFLDQAFGWVDVFAFTNWFLVGQGGVLEMMAHTLFLIGYAGMLIWGIFEGLLPLEDQPGIITEFTPIGWLSAFTQFILKGLGLVRALIDFIVGVWATPIIFFIDALQVALAAFNISIQIFVILPFTAFVTGFGTILILFYYKRTGLSDRVRNIEAGNPLLAGVSDFIEWLTGARAGEQVDNAFTRLLLNFVNATDRYGEPIVIHPQAPAWARDADRISLRDFNNLYATAMNTVDAFNEPLQAIRRAFRTEGSEEPDGETPIDAPPLEPFYPYE